MQENIQTPKLELIKNSRTFKMVIPPAVEEKIRLACASVPNLEWSGVLFFKYRGSFENGDLLVTCKDILLMDIGTASYTEWAADADVISYMAENNLLDCQMGIIHSHNTMHTFFSGTDTATLLQEGQNRNNIVSLIVNNDGKYSAAITRLVTTEAHVKETGQYHLFGDGIQTYEDEYDTEDQYVEYFMFDIVRKEPNKLFSFIDRLKQVMTKKRTTVTATQSGGYGYGPGYYGGGYGMYGGGQAAINKGSQTHANMPVTKPVAPIVPAAKSTVVTPAVKPAEEKSLFNQFNPMDAQPEDDFDEFIDGLTLQIISSDIFAAIENIMDIDTYAKEAMFDLYKERFGEDVSDKSEFVFWIDNVIDFILCHSIHPEVEGYAPGDQTEIIAKAVLERLKKIPTKNIYLTTIIKHVKDYL